MRRIRSIRPNMERALQGETVCYEDEMPYAHGGTRSVEIQYVPDETSDGDVRGYVGLIRDVSDRKRALAALRESEERFRAMADNVAQLAWIADRLGDATWYNKRWYEYTGTTWEEMQGSGWEKVVHPDQLERVNHSIAACRARSHLGRHVPVTR